MTWERNRPTHVPTRIREECLARDGYRCTAIQQDDTQCPETTRLEAAHIEQWREGEQTTLDMVRTLCAWHHNRETQRQAAAARAKSRATRPPTTHPTETHPALR